MYLKFPWNSCCFEKFNEVTKGILLKKNIWEWSKTPIIFNLDISVWQESIEKNKRCSQQFWSLGPGNMFRFSHKCTHGKATVILRLHGYKIKMTGKWLTGFVTHQSVKSINAFKSLLCEGRWQGRTCHTCQKQNKGLFRKRLQLPILTNECSVRSALVLCPNTSCTCISSARIPSSPLSSKEEMLFDFPLHVTTSL